MNQPAASRTSEQTPVTTSTTASPATQDRLATGDGQISVAEGVVQKIAGKACREIPGVHAMGTGGARAFGSIRERIPGSSGPSVAQGVGVEVGETEAAIDLDIVVEYGVRIADLGRSIQRNVKQAVERMTGLRVVEVNVAVDDVYLPAADDEQDTALPRGMTVPPAHSAPRSAVIDGIDVDAVAAAVRACPGVSGLDSGPFGEVASYLPGRKVEGVVVSGRPGDRCRSVPAGGSRHRNWPPLITAVLAPLTGNRPVDVVIADIDDPPGAPAPGVPPGAGRSRPGPVLPPLEQPGVPGFSPYGCE